MSGGGAVGMAPEVQSGCSDTAPPCGDITGTGMDSLRGIIIAGLVGGGLEESDPDMSVVSSMFANSGADASLSAPSLSLLFSKALLCRAVGRVHTHRMNMAMRKMMRRAPREMTRMSFLVKVNPAHTRDVISIIHRLLPRTTRHCHKQSIFHECTFI